MAFTDSLSLLQKVMVTCLASCCKYWFLYNHISMFCASDVSSSTLCQREPSMLCYNYVLVCCEYLCYCLSSEVLDWLQYHSQKFRDCSLLLENNRNCKYTSSWRASVSNSATLGSLNGLCNRTKLQMTVLRGFVCFPLWDSDLIIILYYWLPQPD